MHMHCTNVDQHKTGKGWFNNSYLFKEDSDKRKGEREREREKLLTKLRSANFRKVE